MKDALFAGFAAVAKAVGDGHRLEIVDVLAQGERSVDDLSGEIGQSVANTSQHLQVLARVGLVRSRRERTRVIYRVASDDVTWLTETLRAVASMHLAEVEVLAAEYLGERAGIERVSADELEARLASDRVIVLDVRPSAARSRRRSRSFPGLLDSLPAGAEVVAYCRGPYCVYADDTVRLLRAAGFEARRLDAGFPEWRRAGRPVALASSPGSRTRSASSPPAGTPLHPPSRPLPLRHRSCPHNGPAREVDAGHRHLHRDPRGAFDSPLIPQRDRIHLFTVGAIAGTREHAAAGELDDGVGDGATSLLVLPEAVHD